MPEPIRVKAILAKVESTYGTDATPAAGSDEVQVEENFWNSLTIQALEDNLRDQAHSTFGRAGNEASSGHFATLDLVVPIRGRSAAFSGTNKPTASPLLRCCALSETVDTTAGAETVKYTPTSSSLNSTTIYAYSGGKEYKITGCIGSVTIDLTPGQIGRLRFSIQGLIDPDTDIAEAGLPGTLAFADDGLTVPVVQGAGLTLNAQDPDDFQSFEIDVGVEVAERPGGNAADGHAGFWPSDWSPELSTAFEVFALGTLDPYAARKDGSRWSGDIGDIGSTQYNQYDISWSNLRITDVSHADVNGLAQYDVTGRLENSDATTEDPFELTFK